MTGTSEFATDTPGIDTAPARRARAAVAVVFFGNGVIFGDWVLRIPAIKSQAHADTGPLGLALLCLAVGALCSKPVAGHLVTRYGSGPVTRLGIVLTAAALIPPALARDVVALGPALFAFGAALGVLDVAMNAHGVAVQHRMGRPVMSSLHGMFSVGGLLGSLAGGAAAARGLSLLVHFALVASVVGGAALAASCWLLPASCDVAPKAAGGERTRLPAQYRRPLLFLGLVGLCGMMGEGAVGDWSAIYLHTDLGSGAAFAAAGYSAYSVAMALGRFLGDRCLARWGEVRVVTAAVTFAGGAFALALLAARPVAAVGGFTALGLGLSVVMPALLSMAGRLGGTAPGQAITVISSLAGTGILAGPPFIGFLAQLTGLPTALGAISVLTVCATVLLRFVHIERFPHPVRQAAPVLPPAPLPTVTLATAFTPAPAAVAGPVP